jgi:hypothetical protein
MSPLSIRGRFGDAAAENTIVTAIVRLCATDQDTPTIRTSRRLPRIDREALRALSYLVPRWTVAFGQDAAGMELALLCPPGQDDPAFYCVGHDGHTLLLLDDCGERLGRYRYYTGDALALDVRRWSGRRKARPC